MRPGKKPYDEIPQIPKPTEENKPAGLLIPGSIYPKKPQRNALFQIFHDHGSNF